MFVQRHERKQRGYVIFRAYFGNAHQVVDIVPDGNTTVARGDKAKNPDHRKELLLCAPLVVD